MKSDDSAIKPLSIDIEKTNDGLIAEQLELITKVSSELYKVVEQHR